MKHPITPLMFAMIVLIAGTAGADPPVPAESADLESFVLEKLELQSGTGVTVLPLTTEAGADFCAPTTMATASPWMSRMIVTALRYGPK